MAEVSSDRPSKPEIRVIPPTLAEPVMTLEDFVACYAMPQRAKVIGGYWEASADGCDDSSREFAADEIIHLAQVVCPFVHLLADDPASGRTIGISLSIGFQGARFRIVSQRELVGSKAPRVFQTVREMVSVFPHTVKALAGHRNGPEEEKLFGNGDRLRLVRVISLPDGGRALECKLLRGNMRLLQLPIAYEGHFAEVDDPKGYTLHELVSIARVPRTLKICPDAASPPAIIPGIPENFSGCITLEKPQLFVHIERVLQREDGDPGGAEADGKPFLVPLDCPIDISLREETYQSSEFGSQTPKDLMKKYSTSTPFVARVRDWFEETSILHQHLIRPGHELVFIREETRSSVLVREKGPRRRHFLVPVDHTGNFFRVNHIREDCGIPRRTPIELKSLENASFPFDAICAKDDNPYSNLPEDVLPMDTTLTFEAFIKDDPNVVVAKLADGIICRCFHLPTRTGLCLQFERRWTATAQAEAFKQRWSDRDCLAEEISGTVYNEFMKLFSDYEWFPAEVSPCAVNKPVLEDRGITSHQNGAQKPPKDPKPSSDYLKPDVLPPTLRPRARTTDTPGSTPTTKRRAIPPPPTAPRSSPPPVPSRETRTSRSPCRSTPPHSPEGLRHRRGGAKDPAASPQPAPQPHPQPPQPPPRPPLGSPSNQASPVLPPKQRKDSNDGGRDEDDYEEQGDSVDSDTQSYSYIDVRTLEDCVQYRKKKFPGNVATDGVSIPSDGNVSNFSADQMLLFLREVHAPMGTINAWSRMRVNGRDFAKMTDDRLNEFCIQSIVVQFFRDRSRMHVLSQL